MFIMFILKVINYWDLVTFFVIIYNYTTQRHCLCVAGLGFVTSLVFVFFVGVFASSWIGATVFWLGEWFIKRMPFVKHLYSASKQISAAVSPGIFQCLISLYEYM